MDYIGLQRIAMDCIGLLWIAWQSNAIHSNPLQSFNILVIDTILMDKMVILVIDTMAEENVPRYRVYCPLKCLVTNHFLFSSLLFSS
jgi:hypothetical protein